MMRTMQVRAGVRPQSVSAAQITIFSLALAIVLALLSSTTAFAQGGSATGDLRISVMDPTGKVVTDATVTVRDEAKGLERAATPDGQGGYTARLLPPGTYT